MFNLNLLEMLVMDNVLTSALYILCYEDYGLSKRIRILYKT